MTITCECGATYNFNKQHGDVDADIPFEIGCRLEEDDETVAGLFISCNNCGNILEFSDSGDVE